MADIQYLGLFCFRLRGREGIVLCDPFDRSAGLDMGRPTAHIVTSSHDHPHHNASNLVRPLRDDLFVIDGPGEYEVHSVLITGVRTRSRTDNDYQRGNNTVYVIHLDDITFCHLGTLSQELTQAQLEQLGSVDVLLLPVGGGPALEPTAADGIISQIEPRIVIPMAYALDSLNIPYPLAPLEKFAHEMGTKALEAQPKLSLSASSLPAQGEETRIMVLHADTT